MKCDRINKDLGHYYYAGTNQKLIIVGKLFWQITMATLLTILIESKKKSLAFPSPCVHVAYARILLAAHRY